MAKWMFPERWRTAAEECVNSSVGMGQPAGDEWGQKLKCGSVVSKR